MKKGNGFSIVGSIIIVIIILGVVAFFAGDKIFGRNGMVDKLKEADNEFNKTINEKENKEMTKSTENKQSERTKDDTNVKNVQKT